MSLIEYQDKGYKADDIDQMPVDDFIKSVKQWITSVNLIKG
jgi:hypothetical protein